MTSCNNESLTPLVINRGADVTFTVKLTDSQTSDPYDLTNCTSVQIVMPNEDGSYLTLTLGAGINIPSPSTLGKITVTILAASTSLLEVGIISFEVTMVVNSKTSIVQFQSGLSVLDSLFS